VTGLSAVNAAGTEGFGSAIAEVADCESVGFVVPWGYIQILPGN
jgi:hypothetical protein